MKIPPESPSFSDQEMEAAAEALKWQAASARAPEPNTAPA